MREATSFRASPLPWKGHLYHGEHLSLLQLDVGLQCFSYTSKRFGPDVSIYNLVTQPHDEY